MAARAALGPPLAAPQSAKAHQEMSMLTDLNQDLDAGAVEWLRKKATFQSYQRRTGKGDR